MNRKSINLTQKQIENRALIVTTVVNAIITGAGIWMYFLTDLQMMFLEDRKSTRLNSSHP